RVRLVAFLGVVLLRLLTAVIALGLVLHPRALLRVGLLIAIPLVALRILVLRRLTVLARVALLRVGVAGIVFRCRLVAVRVLVQLARLLEAVAQLLELGVVLG